MLALDTLSLDGQAWVLSWVLALCSIRKLIQYSSNLFSFRVYSIVRNFLCQSTTQKTLLMVIVFCFDDLDIHLSKVGGGLL